MFQSLAKTRAGCRRLFPRHLLHRLTTLATCVVATLVSQFIYAQTVNAESGERPNIVYIMSDDLGIGDVECFGGDRCQIDTPGFDRLASEGVKFTDAHAPASVCVPTRVGIMTGRYAWRFSRPRPDGPWGFLNPRLKPGSLTLPAMLRKAGYRTGYVGKWHLGTQMPTKNGENQGPTNVDYTKPLLVGPRQYGLDESFILPGSLDMFPYVYVRNNRFVGEVTAQRGWSAFNRVGPAADDFEDFEVLDHFSAEAEKFLERQAKQKQPFFLYVALTAPHTPVSPSERFRGKSRIGPYGDFVMDADNCIVRVLNALDKHRLTENTLVIVTSDHGPALYAGDIPQATPNQLRKLEKKGHYASGVYRGYKFSAYEGGLRVPLVARWPGVTPAASTSSGVVGLHDLYRTLAEVAGVAVGDDVAGDSVSYAPLLKNPAAASPRSDIVLRSTNSFVIRKGRWKLLLCPGSGCAGRFGNSPPRDEAWRAAVEAHGERVAGQAQLAQAPFVQLFDLENDPGEQNNLAVKHPERVKSMVTLLTKQIDAGRSTPGPRLNNDRPITPFAGVPAFVLKK